MIGMTVPPNSAAKLAATFGSAKHQRTQSRYPHGVRARGGISIPREWWAFPEPAERHRRFYDVREIPLDGSRV